MVYPIKWAKEKYIPYTTCPKAIYRVTTNSLQPWKMAPKMTNWASINTEQSKLEAYIQKS